MIPLLSGNPEIAAREADRIALAANLLHRKLEQRMPSNTNVALLVIAAMPELVRAAVTDTKPTQLRPMS
jgi:hypothetical protein